MLQTVFNTADHLVKCKVCSLVVYGDEAHEYLANVYHKSCFKCKKCSKGFCLLASVAQYPSSVAEVTYLDKQGDLVCFEDLIR
jgi:hypothetical protein